MKLTFITGFSLAFMILGLIMAFTGETGFLGKRFFFTMVGILGWFIGNKLVELDADIRALEQSMTERQSK